MLKCGVKELLVINIITAPSCPLFACACCRKCLLACKIYTYAFHCPACSCMLAAPPPPVCASQELSLVLPFSPRPEERRISELHLSRSRNCLTVITISAPIAWREREREIGGREGGKGRRGGEGGISQGTRGEAIFPCVHSICLA